MGLVSWQKCSFLYSEYVEKEITNQYQFVEVLSDLGNFSEIRVTFNGKKDMIFGLSDAPLRPGFEIKLILPMVEWLKLNTAESESFMYSFEILS